MNKKSQFIFVGIMIAIMTFIVLVQFINPLKSQINTARSPDNLDCINSSISVGNKATCVIVDWQLPYFIAIGMGAAGAFMGGRLLRQGS